MVGFGRQMDAGAINWTLLHLSTQNMTGHLSDFPTTRPLTISLGFLACVSAYELETTVSSVESKQIR